MTHAEQGWLDAPDAAGWWWRVTARWDPCDGITGWSTPAPVHVTGIEGSVILSGDRVVGTRPPEGWREQLDILLAHNPFASVGTRVVVSGGVTRVERGPLHLDRWQRATLPAVPR